MRSHISSTLFNINTMGWLRLVGSLKLQVSFAKENYKRDYILQERPIILRSLLIIATPYLQCACCSLCCNVLQYVLQYSLQWCSVCCSVCCSECCSVEYAVIYFLISFTSTLSEPCHTHKWVVAHTQMSHVACMEKKNLFIITVMSYIWISHGTFINESRHIYEWTNLSYTTVSDSCHTCEWVMAHMWMSHGTHMYESRHMYTQRILSKVSSIWVMSHLWMSHGTHMNSSRHMYEWANLSYTTVSESCHTCEWNMAHI